VQGLEKIGTFEVKGKRKTCELGELRESAKWWLIDRIAG
jgi:hypothetical protein